MKIFSMVAMVGAVLLGGVVVASCSDASAAEAEMTMYATPTCGCCGAWAEHLRENGFAVNVVYRDDLAPIRAQHKLPRELGSCHIGVIDGYAVEGHVPASVVRRLLAERPEILGIAVPGMPAGSPGMELPDGTKTPYEVFSYDESGPLAVFQHVN